MSIDSTVARISVVADVANANAEIRKLSATVAKLEREVAKTSKVPAAPRGSLLDAAAVTQLASATQAAYQQIGAAVERSFQLAVANRNLRISIDQARTSTQGLVTDYDLTIAANKATQLGVSRTGKEFADLAEAATKLGAKLGQDAGKSLNDVIEGLGKASPEVLNNVGVLLKAEEAQAIYAQRLHTTTAALTDQQKAEAFMVVGRERLLEAARNVDLETENMIGGLQRLKVSIDNAVDSVYMLPESLSQLSEELRANQGVVGWWADQFMEKLGYLTGGFFALRSIIADTSSMMEAMATRGDTLASVRRAVQYGTVETARRDLSNPENARRAIEQIGGALYGSATDTAAGVGRLASGLSGGDVEVRRKRGGRAGPRQQAATAPSGRVGAVDLHEGRMAQRAALAAAEADALERAMEVDQLRYAIGQQSAGELESMWMQVAALDAEREAEEAILAKRIEAATYAGDQEEVRALQHEAEMYRLDTQARREEQLASIRAKNAADERARLDRQRQQIVAWGQTTGSVMSGFAATYDQAAQMAGVSDEKRQAAAMRMGGIVALTEATVAGAKAAVAYASGNIPQGVALTAAALFAGAQGAMLLAGKIPGAATSGGASGGASGAGASPNFGARDRVDSRVPGSPAADGRSGPPRRSDSDTGGQSITVIYSPGVQVGQADAETAEQLAALVARGAKGTVRA